MGDILGSGFVTDDILGSMPVIDGFPRPDWSKVWDRFDECNTDDEREEVSTELARGWLAAVKDAAGEGYEVFESEHFLFLTSKGRERALNLARVAERAFKEMVEGLPGIAGKEGHGKFVCLAFRDVDTYYEYLSYFYPEGEFGASSGCYVSDGYVHFVMNHGEQLTLEFTLVHELTHACLRGCPLPLWLEEGVTQMMEEAILGYSNFTMSREELDRHQEFWDENGLSCFWWGSSFQRADDGMELSYVLAQVLTRNLLSRGRENFLRLLKEADPSDCGDSATREIYGLGVGDLATQFLGAGDWECAPVEAADFFRRALFHQARHEYERAAADFGTALEREARNPEFLNGLAWLLSTCPADSVRDGQRAVGLATRASELTGGKSDEIVDTLAAAYAESGDFDRAVEWARRAVELGEEEHRSGDEMRLKLYEQGMPYREPGATGDGS